VVRWELRPRVFLRTTEFLWQEGHTCHATEDDARDYARRILHEVYEDFMVSVLALPVLVGRKTARERFAGATNTLTCEGMMRDGKALQMGTSHELGQNFAKAFGVQFSTADGGREFAWQTSWGVSTRMVGGLIMGHGDDNGLRVPPRLASVQALVMVVKDGEGVGEAAHKLAAELSAAGVRVAVDDRTDTAFGRRAVDAELKGIPIRVEVGPRDLAEGNVTLARRIPGTKTPTAIGAVAPAVAAALADDQKALHDEALARREERTADVGTAAEAAEAAAAGWARVPWSVIGPEGEAKLAEQSVSVRCLLRPDGSVPEDGDEDGLVAIVGRSY
jgi:prolyl-tRNA synthetase